MALEVLVTGGAGVLGGEIVRHLRLANHRVISCGRVAGQGVDAVWDIAWQDRPSPDCKPQVVVHAAAQVGNYNQSFPESNDLLNTNIIGTLRVANWCISQGVHKLVLVSGAIVYGEWQGFPKTEIDIVKPYMAGAYAVSKWCSEQMAQIVTHANCGLVILRMSSLYGIGYDRGLIQKLLQQGKETGTICLEAPFDDAFDLLHISDAARTVQHVIENNKTGLWNVGGGGLTIIRELAELCARQSNAQVSFSDKESVRPARIINWVDDRKARSELEHENLITLDVGVSEIGALCHVKDKICNSVVNN